MSHEQAKASLEALHAALDASTAVLASLVGDLSLAAAALERIHDRDLPRVIAALGAMRAQCELRRAAGTVTFDPTSGRPLAASQGPKADAP